MKAAREASRLLRGIVCVYKPAECSTKYLIVKLKNSICNDLNSLETSTPEEYFGKEACLDKEANKEFEKYFYNSSEASTNVKPSYADNVLCAGPRYKTNKFHISIPKDISDFASGVLSKFYRVISINQSAEFISLLRKLNFTRCYHLKGILGQVTRNFHISERVLMKAKYNHVTKEKFEVVLASYQSAAQRRVFEEYGKQLHTQEAYNFAIKGLQRPYWNGPPVLYSVKLVDFEPPDFTIEVQCANETKEYLLSLIHNIGVSLKSYATCSGARCLRQGCFHIEHALVKQQWNLAEVLNNISLCGNVLKKTYPREMKYSPIVRAFDNSKEKLSESKDLQIYDTSKEKSEVVST